MSWDAIATFALAFVTLVGLNLGAIRWILGTQARELHARLETIKREGTDFSHGVERELLKLKAELPVEYVRREDWIRFSNTLEAKLDALVPSCAPRFWPCANGYTNATTHRKKRRRYERR
jgi:hypothetical protein